MEFISKDRQGERLISKRYCETRNHLNRCG